MDRFAVSRVMGKRLIRVGTIQRSTQGDETFSYAQSYLERGNGPLSLSLPLSTRPYSYVDIRPYFDGLLPEGPSRDALVAQLLVPETGWLAILASVGLDCVGDVVVQKEQPDNTMPDEMDWDEGSYIELSDASIKSIVFDLSSMAKSNDESRLSGCLVSKTARSRVGPARNEAVARPGRPDVTAAPSR